MSDVRNIMQDRLKAYERFLGVLQSAGEITAPVKVRNYQKGTLTIITDNYQNPPISLVVEGTDNKGENLWFNIDPQEDDIAINSSGMVATTYSLETTWLRVRWVSGGGAGTRVRPSLYVSKTITAK